MQPELVIYVVDDDEAVRQSLEFLLKTAGMTVRGFDNAKSFLDVLPEIRSGCIITDVRMPEITGIDLLRRVKESGVDIPVIVITGHGDISLAVEAMKIGAVDFLEKPFDDAQLRAAIDGAFALEDRRLGADQTRRADAAKLERLTPREREVLEHAARGLHAKEIGAALGISPRTVEVHKAHLMEKLGVRNVAELVRFALLGNKDA